MEFRIKAPVVVTEGISGTWFYHLSWESDTTKSVCGARTMPTEASLDTWGTTSHLGERYCKECMKQVFEDDA